MKRHLLSLAILAATVSVAAGLVATSAARPISTPAATISSTGSPLGRILVDGNGRTLYLFEKDSHGRSACYGQCALYWPPLLTLRKPVGLHGAKTALLGTTTRSDGTTQVTYAGHPLYRFRQDTRPGLTTGQGLNAVRWRVVRALADRQEDREARGLDDPRDLRQPEAQLGQQRRPPCRRSSGGTGRDRRHDRRRAEALPHFDPDLELAPPGRSCGSETRANLPQAYCSRFPSTRSGSPAR